MAKDSGSSPVDLVTAVAEVAPLVGNVIGTLARTALSKNEFDTIQACLKEAMVSDLTTRPPGKLSWRKRRRVKKEWQDARSAPFEDLLASGATILFHATDPDETSAGSSATPASSRAPGSTSADIDPDATDSARSGLVGAEVTLEASPPEDASTKAADTVLRELVVTSAAWLSFRRVVEEAKSEAADARSPDTVVPWTMRVSAAITNLTTDQWNVLKDVADDEDKTARRAQAAVVILGRKDARPEHVDEEALRAFGERVGRRFEANLAAEPTLRTLVERLDHHDEVEGQLALLHAAQGMRVAGLAIAAAGFLAGSALLEIALRTTF